MAFSADGVLYAGSDDWAAVPNTLFTINPATGSMTIVGETGVPNREGDLAFDPTTGNLFQLKSAVYTAGGVDSSDLMLLDKSNGDPTFVGTVRRGNDLSAMAFDGVGRLFVVDTDDEELLLVDTLTASILDTTALSGPLGDVAGMDSDPTSSALYVADGGSDGSLGSLYTVDPATGQVSTIGPTGLTYGLSGLVFVPEPGACSILLLGTLILGRQRARANRT